MKHLRVWAPRVGRVALAVLAALVAAVIGYLVVALVVSVTAMSAPEEQSGFLAWILLAGVLWSAPVHGVMLTVQTVHYTLVPWGLTIGVAFLTYGAGAWWGRTSRVSNSIEYLVGIGAFAVTYAGLAAGVLLLTRSPEWTASLPRVALHTGLIALVAGGIGARRSSGLALHIRTHIPAWVMIVVRAVVVAIASLVGAGALLLIGWLIARFSDVLQVQTLVGGGFVGAVSLLLITLAFLPTLLLWAASYILGAGFSLGSDSLVSPFLAVTSPADVPLIPIIAAFPETAVPLAWLYPCITVASGLLTGYFIARRAAGEQTLMRLVIALLAATGAAFMMAALAWAASGSLGEMRLSFLGPLPEFAASLAWIGLVVGMVPTALLMRRPRRPTLRVAEPDILERVDGELWVPR
ncbi:MAG: hypothetical protein FJW97_00550 [Actinobacteria bacterium]|nr:hypothetical protein [Actinomycetota bacterium]